MTPTQPPALLPCPHCGTAPELAWTETHGGFVHCPNADCYNHNSAKHDREAAIAAWNRRATEQPALHDDLRADIAAARRERDEAREAQEYAELQLAYLANEMVFNGNSIGWIASKADNYKAALGRAWSALTESGGKCDGKTELAEAIRQHFAALSTPASEAVAWRAWRDGRDITNWLHMPVSEWALLEVADGITVEYAYGAPPPAPAAHAGGEAVNALRELCERMICSVASFDPSLSNHYQKKLTALLSGGAAREEAK